jgi:bla regulator protein BlaR1
MSFFASAAVLPTWSVLGEAANHLWQSTLVAGAAGLLVRSFKANHAQVRYWLWLVASAKFLIPFSLLVSLGSHLGIAHAMAERSYGYLFLVQQIGGPFAIATTAAYSTPQVTSMLSLVARFVPTSLVVMWFCGFAAVMFNWCGGWRRLSKVVRSATPAEAGREAESLRRAEKQRATRSVPLLLSPSLMEPGIFGALRPKLVLPQNIAERLTRSELDAVIAHELCHVRRRDNLAGVLHMLVEALFWFYPLVWWIGARLMDERERACDEEVLQLGSNPQAYAEGILKVCEFYLESRVSCAAGVTGSNLKERIENIMIHRRPLALNWTKKVLLGGTGFIALAGPFFLGLFCAPQIRAQAQSAETSQLSIAWESVLVRENKTGEPMAGVKVQGRPMRAILFKPERFLATNVSLSKLIQLAYGVQETQIEGVPEWATSANFDIEARLSSANADQLKKLSPEQSLRERDRLLRGLLADSFKLSLHTESRNLPAYTLVVAQGGSKLKVARPGDTYADGLLGLGDKPLGPGILVTPAAGKLVGQAAPLAWLAGDLSDQFREHPVVDQTGLTDKYDFTLQWSYRQPSGEPDRNLLAALENQLGLKVQLRDVPTEMIVVDKAEKPPEN